MSNNLSKLYYDPSLPTGYSGASRIIEKAKQLGIPKEKVEKWLQQQDAYTKHKKVIRHFPRRHYTLLTVDDLWQADLADVTNLSNWNDGVKFWLVVIDCFSKFTWVKPLKTKTSIDVSTAIKAIITDSGRKPRNFNTDKGTEFMNEKVKNFFKQINVNFYSSQNPETKACFAERVIRTLKERMYRMLTHKNTKRYLEYLGDLVKGYNAAKHRSIGIAPIDVNADTEDNVRAQLNKRVTKITKTANELKVGAHVRITKGKSAFQKGYLPGWSEEIFKIASKNDSSPKMYKIEDAAGELILGSFYRQELQQVLPTRVFKIEKILRTRTRNSTKEYLIKWLGYPVSMSSWEPASEVKVLNKM